MDAAVVGIPVSSPQPTQLTFEDGFGERRYATGAVNEPLEVLKTEFCLPVRCRPSTSRSASAPRVWLVSAMSRTARAIDRTRPPHVGAGHRLGLCPRHQAVNDPRRGAQAPVLLEINAVRYLIRQLVSTAAALQEAAPEVSNGAIAPERLIITRRSPHRRRVRAWRALEQLAHSRARYWRSSASRCLAPSAPPFDARADVTQIGAVALAPDSWDARSRPMNIPSGYRTSFRARRVRSVMGARSATTRSARLAPPSAPTRSVGIVYIPG